MLSVAKAGDYTLIVSAFESRHTGPYTFKVECSTRIELSPVPQEGSGMFSKPVRGEWYAMISKRSFLVLTCAGRVKARVVRRSSRNIGPTRYMNSTCRSSPKSGAFLSLLISPLC